MKRKYLIYLLICQFALPLHAQDVPMENRWNYGIGLFPFNEKMFQRGENGVNYLDLVIDVNVEHKIAKKWFLGADCYFLRRFGLDDSDKIGRAHV